MPGVAFGGQRIHDVSWVFAQHGRQFFAADADQNDRVTGQTSFANTTPTFLLHNPSTSGVVAMGFVTRHTQAGSVAGGDINVEYSTSTPSAYSTGGTAEKAISGGIGMTGAPTEACTLYTGATATAGYTGIKVYGHVLGPDVSPAEGVINNPEYHAPAGLWLWPNSSLDIFTYASSTGPTWDWNVEWWEIPVAWLTR